MNILDYIKHIFKKSDSGSEEEKRRQLEIAEMNRRHNVLSDRVAVWFRKLEPCERMPMFPSKLLEIWTLPVFAMPALVQPFNEIITTKIEDFVFKKKKGEYPLRKSSIKELHAFLYSMMLEYYEIDCQDDEIDKLIEISLSSIDESIKASKVLSESEKNI